MKIQQLVPAVEVLELDALIAGLRRSSSHTLSPFDPELLEFCTAFSHMLFQNQDAKRFAELQALAFWMRRSALFRLREEFEKLQTADTCLVPRGLVFHIPPANVDTIFIYSWLVSALVGNRNVLRISHHVSEPTRILCRLFNDSLGKAGAALRNNTIVVQYGHEEEITRAISALADVRVIWGGDASISSIRSIPVPPHCKELTFADRCSFSLIRASKFLQVNEATRTQLASNFYSDTYWFDQRACSSPRLLIWLGNQEECAQAGELFFAMLQHELQRRGYVSDTSQSVNKLTYLAQSILDRPVIAARRLSNELMVADLGSLQEPRREHCGGGFLFQFRIERIEELADHVARRDQTMTCFGFEPSELRGLVRLLNGRGIDRVVPIGNALTFQRFWDGYDLLAELARHVYLEPQPEMRTVGLGVSVCEN